MRLIGNHDHGRSDCLGDGRCGEGVPANAEWANPASRRDGRPPGGVGVLSERDVGGTRGSAVRAGKTVGDSMSGQAITAAPTTTVRQAANLLRARNIGCLPIVEDGEIEGLSP